MRFLVDMGIGRKVVDWLSESGHDSVHLRDEGLHRLPDDAIFQKALTEGRTLLTCDLDFGEIASRAGSSNLSIVVLRLRNSTSPRIIERLDAVLKDSADALQRGAVVSVTEDRHRVRRLPIGEESED